MFPYIPYALFSGMAYVYLLWAVSFAKDYFTLNIYPTVISMEALREAEK